MVEARILIMKWIAYTTDFGGGSAVPSRSAPVCR